MRTMMMKGKLIQQMRIQVPKENLKLLRQSSLKQLQLWRVNKTQNKFEKV